MMFERDDDEEDDGAFGSKKCINVEIPHDFDPNKVPTTGEEYLQYVMYEASKCDPVAISKVKIKHKDCEWSGEKVLPKSHKSLLPTKEWNKQKVDEFTKFRKFIHSKLPQPNVHSGDDLRWRNKIDEEYPKFSVVSKFNLNTLICFAETLADRLNNVKHGGTFTDRLATWIFTILALLQVELLSSDMFHVRKIGKECASIRSRLPANAPLEMYSKLNFVICIIGMYFKQSDLVSCVD